MKFARYVFLIAGIYGLLVLVPMYFMEQKQSTDFPPPITHPEFYYGFLGVAVAWQVAFLVLATDPKRYRLMIIPAILEKASFAIAVIILYLPESGFFPDGGRRASRSILRCLVRCCVIKDLARPKLHSSDERYLTIQLVQFERCSNRQWRCGREGSRRFYCRISLQSRLRRHDSQRAHHQPDCRLRRNISELTACASSIQAENTRDLYKVYTGFHECRPGRFRYMDDHRGLEHMRTRGGGRLARRRLDSFDRGQCRSP
jgi:hypothetical protein